MRSVSQREKMMDIEKVTPRVCLCKQINRKSFSNNFRGFYFTGSRGTVLGLYDTMLMFRICLGHQTSLCGTHTNIPRTHFFGLTCEVCVAVHPHMCGASVAVSLYFCTVRIVNIVIYLLFIFSNTSSHRSFIIFLSLLNIISSFIISSFFNTHIPMPHPHSFLC